MIDHHENVRKAHEEDDLLFGTVESWIVYVSAPHADFEPSQSHLRGFAIEGRDPLRALRAITGGGRSR